MSPPSTLHCFPDVLAIITTCPAEKMKKMKVEEKRSICKFGFVHFWCRSHPKKLRILQEKGPKFP
jgi:hypothetical protein